MIDLTCNGIVVQRKQNQIYQGIEGDNWFLCYNDDPNEYFRSFHDKNIDIIWSCADSINCCVDINYVKRYIDTAIEKHIDIRLLQCWSEKKLPHMSPLRARYLGFDYAYPAGYYYSCITNDILTKRIPEFRDIRLNKYGLFETIEEIVSFVKLRESLANSGKYESSVFEEGDFTIYKLEEIDPQNIDLNINK